jgi:hypothetical protein
MIRKLALITALFCVSCTSLPPAPTQPPKIADTFDRADGTLGPSWRLGISGNVEGLVGLGGVLISNAGYGPVNERSADALAIWGNGDFSNDQWSSSQIKSIAAPTSTVNITAASRSGSDVTYTYTLSTGNALILGQPEQITGMADAGNNGSFIITSLGAGTFTVANAAGVTHALQTGTGISPSDSIAGIAVRASEDGRSAYFFIAGTNSFNFTSDRRIYTRELWKCVNGMGRILAFQTSPTIPDVAGDRYMLVIIGSNLYVEKNGAVLSKFNGITDTDLTSGRPGIWTWSISGPNEYSWNNWRNSGVMGMDPPGNNATTWGNWQGGDYNATLNPLPSDTPTSQTTISMPNGSAQH